MKSITIILIVLILSGGIAFAQPDTLWTKTFGGSGWDVGYGVQQTTDDGFIVAGYTNSYGAGEYDVYLIKMDASGTEQWSQTLGGSNEDYSKSVQQTSDGGYIITGWTDSYGAGWDDVYLIKTDATGTEQLSQVFGGSSFDYGESVQQTSDGGYIIAGHTASYGAGNGDVYLIKTDASGTEQWSQTFGGSSGDFGYSGQQTSDGGYIIVGYTLSYGAGSTDVYLIKADAAGTEQWSQTFGGSNYDSGESVQQTSDGGYIIAGHTYSFGAGEYDVYLIKTDAAGTEQWSQTFGGSNYDYGESVQQTSDGGYIIAGHTDSFGAGNGDVYLIKTDAAGTEHWSQTFGGGGYEYSRSVQQTSDGGYIIAGQTNSYGAGSYDVWLIRLESEGTLVEDFNTLHPSEFALHPPYPNPFNPSTVLSFELRDAGFVSLSIYDITGREVASLAEGMMPTGAHQVVFDGADLSSGVYFARLTAGEFQQTRKILLIK